jgi:hypothetical protein
MNAQTKKGYVWAWTDKAEERSKEIEIYDRKAGEPIYEHYRKSCPRSWVLKGYVEQMKEG